MPDDLLVTRLDSVSTTSVMPNPAGIAGALSRIGYRIEEALADLGEALGELWGGLEELWRGSGRLYISQNSRTHPLLANPSRILVARN